jgi:hypothetical protein
LIYYVRATTAQVSPQQFLQLIADPHRWRLVNELARSDRRVGELTQLVGEPQSLVSYHLRELRDASLVSSRRSWASLGRPAPGARTHAPRARRQLVPLISSRRRQKWVDGFATKQAAEEELTPALERSGWAQVATGATTRARM